MDSATGGWSTRFLEHEQARRQRVGSPQSIAERLKQRYPDHVKGLLAAADLAVRGELRLPGTGGKPAFVGNPPDWHRIANKDKEYLWGLNRMLHWIPLLQAYALSGAARYAEKVVTELDDWLERCPPPPLDAPVKAYDRVNPWRMLEVGLRMYRSWPLIPQFLAGTPWLTDERADRLAASLVDHARRLAKFSPKLWPRAHHNHYMMEMLGLLNAAMLLQDLPEAAGWRQQAERELVRCCQNQFTPEGGQAEGCPHYHAVCLDVLARAVRTCREAGLAAPPAVVDCLKRGMDYMLQSTRPTGDIVPWGDSDVVPVGVVSAVKTYAALGEASWLNIIGGFAPAQTMRDAILGEAWALDDLDAALAEAQREPETLPPTMAWHRGLDQVSARNAWSSRAASVFFACRSPVYNGHAHVDPAGFDFTSLGKPLLVDPGRFTYRGDDDRRQFKLAESHNTITLDEREPFAYTGTWSYGPQQPGRIIRVDQPAGHTYMLAEHANFQPAIHRRALALLDIGVLVIVDRLAGLSAGQRVQRWFHFNSTTLHWDPASARASTADADANLTLWLSAGSSASTLPGRISPLVDVAYPSMRLRIENAAEGETLLLAAVAVPYEKTPIPRLSRLEVSDERVRFELNEQAIDIALPGLA